MSGWIVNRRPRATDADKYGNVWAARSSDGVAIMSSWRSVSQSELAWRPIKTPKPYDYSKDNWIKVGTGSSCNIEPENVRAMHKRIGNVWYVRKLNRSRKAD